MFEHQFTNKAAMSEYQSSNKPPASERQFTSKAAMSEYQYSNKVIGINDRSTYNQPNTPPYTFANSCEQYFVDLTEQSGYEPSGNAARSNYTRSRQTRSGYAASGHVRSGYMRFPGTPNSLHNTNRSEYDRLVTTRLPIVSRSVHLRECLAEFLGTFVMVCFGLGVNNQVALSDGKNGTWMSINFCWGVAVLIGVYCSEGVSGAHLNTAVTFAHAAYGRLPWWKVPGYTLAQVLGSFFGAACVFLLYLQKIKEAYPSFETTQGNFATYPSEGISGFTAFYTEMVATAALLLGIYAITDERNRPAGPIGAPFAFTLLIMALGMAFGMNTGYAMNPARDFGPRLFTSLVGYGSKVFSLDNHYFWTPIAGPLLGGVIGVGIYTLLIQIHHPLGSSTAGSTD